MIVMGLLLIVTWAYYLFLGRIDFMRVKIYRDQQTQKYWVIQGIILLLGLFCIWVQWPQIAEALQQQP